MPAPPGPPPAPPVAPPAPPGQPPAPPVAAPPGPPSAPPAPPAAPSAPVVDHAPSSSLESGRAPDPHGFATASAGLSAGTQKRAKAAVVAAAMALEDGEQVRAMVCGQYLAHDGVAIFTDRRVLCINSRTFAPDQDSIGLSDLAGVRGWVESNRATLQISGGSQDLVIGDIKEVDAAQKFAGDLRANL